MLVQKKLVDQDTLMRLIEECREEEERRAIMCEMNDDTVSVSGYTEKSIVQLKQIDMGGRRLEEADAILSNIEKSKLEYF
jgi:phage replication-related protein YjqB (UPF0714/DUF867 family)